MRTRKTAFSMIEILVVCTILMVLVSLMLPALSRAQGMARKTFCLSNIRQIAQTTNLYKTDARGVLPYTSTWLVDFSFLPKYISNYKVAVCPDTDDVVSSEQDLVGNTSYHYMGTRYDWEKNNLASGDGSEYGFDATNSEIAQLLSERQEKVIYDRTSSVHYGFFNVVFLESMQARSVMSGEYGNYWYFADAGNVDCTGNPANATQNKVHNNNGHGNNVDGVDCSNPGQGNGGPNGGTDASGSVDDEKGKGGNPGEMYQEQNMGSNDGTPHQDAHQDGTVDDHSDNDEGVTGGNADAGTNGNSNNSGNNGNGNGNDKDKTK